jgi:hypothetical protein
MSWKVAALVITAGSTATALACILADPPPIPNALPPLSPPVIVSSLATPPLGEPIAMPPTSAPLTFTVAVLVDPNQTLEWKMIEDFNAQLDQGQPLTSLVDGGVQILANADAGEILQIVTVTVNPIDLSTCHHFTFVAAYGFQPMAFALPDSRGGDSVTWSYQPLPDCSLFDAAPPTDAAESDNDGADE